MKHEIIKNGDEEITLPVPENYSDCFTLIRSDMFRVYGCRKSAAAIWARMIFTPRSATSLLIWHRLLQLSDGGIFRIIFKAMHRLARKYCKVDMPPAVRIGYGFYIGHGMCFVINGGTIIGNNVNISQFVNIGTNRRTPAIIGDNVYIGASACIVEDVRIGSNVTIGTGAVVTRSIPAGATAVGVPAKVLNYSNQAEFIKNPWLTSN